MAELPLARKFFAYVPETHSHNKRHETPASEQTQQGPKRRKKNDSSDQDHVEKIGGDDDSAELEITSYIDVLVPSPVVPKGRNAGKPATTAIPKGPFFFFHTSSFDDFKAAFAQCLPCPPANLDWNKINWKFDTPANSPLKRLSDAAGYKAMVKGIVDRKRNFVIRVMTPPPSKNETVCMFVC